jgi:hypothetical protein
VCFALQPQLDAHKTGVETLVGYAGFPVMVGLAYGVTLQGPIVDSDVQGAPCGGMHARSLAEESLSHGLR